MDRDDKLLTKDELNLAEFPFTLSSHRPPKGTDRIEVTETKLDREGRAVKRVWTVLPSAFGLPLATDEEVFLGLMYFLSRADFRDRTVYFTQHSLFRLLSWGGSLRDYERLELSLRRLKGAVIECKDSFWNHKAQCYATHQFSLIDSVSLYRRELKSGDEPFVSQVTFNEWIFESFKAGFLKTLDLNLYLALKSPLARKLFRFLDKKLYRSETYEIELMRLAGRLALTDNAYPSIVKKHLDRSAHAELQAVGFLKNVEYVKKGHALVVHYQIAPKPEWRLPTTETRKLPQDNPLALELIARGVTRDIAKLLVKEHGEKRVADQLEVFDHLMALKSPVISKNPAGFLRSSIEKDFQPPAGYVSRAERQRQKEEADRARQHDRDKAAATEREQAERKAKIDAFWDSLTPADRQALEAEALGRLNTFAAKRYREEKADQRVGSGHHALRVELEMLISERHLTVAETE